MSDAKHIIVIGAGIVGVSTAIWLQRAGQKVTLIEKDTPGQGTSYGNAGILASCSIVPVTGPGLFTKAPGMLLNHNFPLFLRWSYLPRLVPWLVRYMSHANDADTRKISQGLEVVVGDSVEQHKSLVRGTAAADWVTESDYVFAYADRKAFDADAYVWGIRRDAGFIPELLEGDAVREYDPAFGPGVGLLAVMKDHGHIRAPGRYVQALADVFLAEGGTLIRSEVRDIELTGGRITSVTTGQGAVACDSAVICTGVWSKELSQKLGLKVPLESERGYHIVFKGATNAPRVPAMVAAGKFVATPMEGGLRCAGVVEFGGLEAGASKAPLALLRKTVRETFPKLEWEEEEEWLGHRPATSDSLPLIGEIGKTGVFAGFGHHHIGLTGGPKTGRLLADLITKSRNNLDLTAFDPGRFG